MRPFQTQNSQPPTYAEQQIDLPPPHDVVSRSINMTRRLAQVATVIFYGVAIGAIALQLTL